LVLHEFALLRRNKRLVWSHLIAVLLGFAIFVRNVRNGALPLAVVFFLMMLLFPTAAAPTAIGVHMFVGEKERRTMEPLLLLPVSLRVLMGAKFLTMLGVSFGELLVFFVAGVAALKAWGTPALYSLVVNSAMMYFAGVLMPLLGVLFGLIAMMVSARATSTQSATQVMMFVIIPFIAVLGSVGAAGLTVITRPNFFIATLALLILDVVAYVLARAALRPEVLIRRRGQ